MVDIHCHILPNIDDGPATIEESVNMARKAQANGIKVIIATPHYIEGEGYTSYLYNQAISNNLKRELLNKEINIEIFLGNEVFITPYVLKLLDNDDITTINKTRYMLIELPMLDIPCYVEQIIFDLRLKGLYPIFAHPERNLKIIENPNILYDFIKKGALIQLNLSSLEKGNKDKAGKTAGILLENNMVHFIASDAHSSNKYNLSLKHVFEVMSRYTEQKNSEKILLENPRKVINNEKLTIDEPIRYNKKSIFHIVYKLFNLTSSFCI